jgi:hypothetical protein
VGFTVVQNYFFLSFDMMTQYAHAPIYFFLWDLVTGRLLHTRAYTHYYERTHAHPTLWAPPKNWVGPANLEIDEITIGASLSTNMSLTTKRIAPLNPGINSEKYEHPHLSRELQSGWAGSTTRNPTRWATLSSPSTCWTRQKLHRFLSSFLSSRYHPRAVLTPFFIALI